MNKLLFPNGGVPLQGDDFVFLQNSYKEAFKGIYHEFARSKNGNIILSGCEITPNGGVFDLSEGYILLDYEVLYVPAAAGLTFSLVLLELDVSNDPAGNDIFFDNVARDTYEVRKAKPYISGTAPTLFVQVLDENRLPFLITKTLDPDEVVALPSSGEKHTFTTFLSGAVASPTGVVYVIKKNNRVLFHGSVDVSAVTVGARFLEIPVGFRKSASSLLNESYVCSYEAAAAVVGLETQYLSLAGILGTATSNGRYLSLNGISYDID